MKNYVNWRTGLALILAVAVVLVAVDFFILYGSPRLHKERDVNGLPIVDSAIFEHSEIADFESASLPENKDWMKLNVPAPEPDKYMTGPDILLPEPAVEPETPPLPDLNAELPPETPNVDITPEREEKPKPAPEPEPFLRNAGDPAKIVIIIDDMGMDRKRSQRVVDLPVPLTLAWLPYAPKLEGITQEAKTKGHELIIHMPMEPMDSGLNPGSIALRSGMSDEEIDAMLDKAFNSFQGYVGLNNHMGSRLTKDDKAMTRVMANLKKHNLFFVDSKTIGSSVASTKAAEAGIKYGDRDVFLDHQDTPAFVHNALRQTERMAMKKGYAIAIGHPKDSTINALKEWLPTLKERGFELVPVSAVVRRAKNYSAQTVSSPTPVPTDLPVTLPPSSGSYPGPVQQPSPPPG
jgi:polysaccharide deacetylase 2 family uncharacterized protein YibQ